MIPVADHYRCLLAQRAIHSDAIAPDPHWSALCRNDAAEPDRATVTDHDIPADHGAGIDAGSWRDLRLLVLVA
jgi:hypothetical protein